MHVRMPVLHLADHPFPERHRLGVRIVDPEDLHALLDPEQDDVPKRVPDRRQGVAVEVDVDDVLVFLRRVLGVFDRAVRPPVEPFRMLLDPGMVGRAVDREVDRDLEPVGVGRLDQRRKILEAAEVRMQRVMPARLAADGIGRARIVRRRRRACCCGPCGWSCRSDGSAGSTARRSPALGCPGRRSITSLNVP